MTTEKQKILKDCLHLFLEENLKEMAQTEEYRLKCLREKQLEQLIAYCLNEEQQSLFQEYSEEIATFYGQEITRNHQK